MVKYSELNENQKLAVTDESNHLRIVAGAGSGKTRVLTMRIVYLIEKLGVSPKNILAITFTNKAAKEMKKRILEMLGDSGSGCTISTIHSLCMRILSEDIEPLKYPRNFTVIDADDQKQILKEAYKILNLDKKDYPYGPMLDYIANNKYERIDAARAINMAYGDTKLIYKAKVYEYYEERLRQVYGLDFDDLILWTTKLFDLFPDKKEKWARKYHYIHVDEFQDIDKEQYKLIKQLASCHDNVYVVGDPDQTIYTWRGADVNIIVNFDKDFKDTKTIVLNENYRSTNNILSGANSLIKNNKMRVEKDLFSKKGDGEKIKHKTLAGEYEEALFVVNEVLTLESKGNKIEDMAVLYRSNYLSREIEKALIENHIPYVIYGGIRFYERMEVKDILSYLRLIVTGDDLAFQRVINQPKRGIGQKTVDAIFEIAQKEHITMYEVIKRGLYEKQQKTFENFVNMVEKWKVDVNEKELEVLLQEVLNDSGYRTMLEKDNETERLENVKSLIDDIKEYSEDYPGSTLQDYLSMISLYTDKAMEQEGEALNLMTIHSAKGLEFDTVFVVGMSEGIFPSERTLLEGMKGLEEERRLAYVAYTRAKRLLYLLETNSFSYVLNGAKSASRFIDEIDPEFIEHLNAKKVVVSSIFDEEIIPKERIEGTPKTKYKISDQVIHGAFGEGVVVAVDGDVLSIAFAHPIGVKKIKADFPGLRKKTKDDYS